MSQEERLICLQNTGPVRRCARTFLLLGLLESRLDLSEAGSSVSSSSTPSWGNGGMDTHVGVCIQVHVHTYAPTTRGQRTRSPFAQELATLNLCFKDLPCVCACVCTHLCPQRPGERTGIPRAGDSGGCELPEQGDCLCKHFLTLEPSLQSCYFIVCVRECVCVCDVGYIWEEHV